VPSFVPLREDFRIKGMEKQGALSNEKWEISEHKKSLKHKVRGGLP